MPFQRIPGQGLYIPAPPAITFGPIVFSPTAAAATGAKIAHMGRVFYQDRTSATKDITKIGFCFGAVTKAGGSALTVSLQDVSLTSGPPLIPDETQDQTVAIANANASFLANTWLQTAALSANRTVALGDRLAVVWEYDGGGRLGSDTFTHRLLSGQNGPHDGNLATRSAAGTWTAASNPSSVILEFTDGSFGTLLGGWPNSNISSIAFNSGTVAADEYALEFSLPFPCKMDGAWAYLFAAASADFSVVLYDGTTAMTNGTVTFDPNNLASNSAARLLEIQFPAEIQLDANHTYRLAFKPTTTNNMTLFFFDVNDVNHFQAHAGGTSWRQVDRVDAGAWGTANSNAGKRRPFAGIRISSLDDATGTGSTFAAVFARSFTGF